MSTQATDAETFDVGKDSIMAFFEAMNTVANEGVVETHEDGLSCRLVDPATVMMAEIRLRKPGGYPDGHTFGVNVTELIDVLDPLSWGDVTVELDADRQYLHFRHGADRVRYSYISPDTVRYRPDVPELDLSVKAPVEPDAFARALDTAEAVADKAQFRWDEDRDGLEIEAWGDDRIRYHVTLATGRDVVPSGEVDSQFSTDYLDELPAFLRDRVETVTVGVGDHEPLEVAVSAPNGLSARYMLAPRIAGGDRS